MLPVAGSIGTWPDTNSMLPAAIAGEYGPMAFGAFGLEIAVGISYFLAGMAAGAYAALMTLPERKHRVQTRIRLMPPLISAFTVWRFGSNRRALTLFAWLCCRPTTGRFPQSSHSLAINGRWSQSVS